MDVDELRRQQEAARAFMEEEGRRLSEATRPGEGTGRRGQRYRNADGDGEEDGDAESEPDKKRRLLETLRQDFPRTTGPTPTSCSSRPAASPRLMPRWRTGQEGAAARL